MEILALKATISEQVLNELLTKYLPEDAPVEEMKIAVTPDGVAVDTGTRAGHGRVPQEAGRSTPRPF